MWRTWSNRWQAVVVAVLFLGSLAALLVNTFATLQLPERELRARNELGEAGRRMAERAASIVASMPAGPPDELLRFDRQLHDVASEVLAEYPGVEGGFYLNAGGGMFAGYAFPTSTHKDDSGSARREPPPLETPYIRLQAQESLASQTEDSLVNVRDVGPSRVMFLTERVGHDPQAGARPARIAAWVMFRLVDPEQLRSDVRHYQVSTGLAIGGLGLSLLLMLNIGRACGGSDWSRRPFEGNSGVRSIWRPWASCWQAWPMKFAIPWRAFAPLSNCGNGFPISRRRQARWRPWSRR